MVWPGYRRDRKRREEAAAVEEAKKKEEEKKEREINFSAIYGSLQREVDPFGDTSDKINDSEMWEHVISQGMSRVLPTEGKSAFHVASGSEITQLDAALAKRGYSPGRRRKNASITGPSMPHVYANPMQSLDYRLFEGLLMHTFIGALADAYVKFIIGDGFRPKIVPIKEGGHIKKSDLEDIKKIEEDLAEIDSQVFEGEEGLDATFQQKFSSILSSCLMYNRGALIFSYKDPVIIRGETYKDIPSDLIFAHARDLGMNTVDAETHRLLKVQWVQDTSEDVTKDDMIYLWNPLTSSKTHNSWHYGISILSPLIPIARLINKLITQDFMVMAENAHTGLFVITVKPEGQTRTAKEEEYAAAGKRIRPSRPAFLLKDPSEVKVDTIRLDPKIEEFRNLMESLIKQCISIMGMPQVGFYDEAAANRDTMTGKLQLTIRTNVEPTRKWIGDAAGPQWYGRWFKAICKRRKLEPLLRKYRVEIRWTDLHITEWQDMVEAALRLNAVFPLKENAMGKIMFLDNFSEMIDTDRLAEQRVMEEMQSGGGSAMPSSGTGAPIKGSLAPSAPGKPTADNPEAGAGNLRPGKLAQIGRQRQAPI